MKTLLLNLWAWIVAHPAETMGGLYVALNAINKAIPVNASKTSRIARWLDIACVLTQRGAVGATSWPVVGRSIAKEIAAPERETQAPPPPRESEPGYAESRVLAAIAAVSLVALALLTGCPIPPPDGCPPRATRCSPSGVPQSCTLGQYWSSMRPERPCSAGSVCCYTRSPYGRELHACVPPEDCLPEPAATDAGAEGGAQ